MLQLISQTQQNNEWQFNASTQAIMQNSNFMPVLDQILDQYQNKLKSLMQQAYTWEYKQYPKEAAEFVNIIQMHTAEFIQFVDARISEARGKKLDSQIGVLDHYLDHPLYDPNTQWVDAHYKT